MSAHLPNELVERFHAQALTRGDRSVIYDHCGAECVSLQLRRLGGCFNFRTIMSETRVAA